ncbi:retrovirus-related pol polyprotein from transposon TNT 1-94 [Tanacetum coccineum]|uniref:Retrovirus-related pol polyprotein from transposon TNT 1-94 n=1 Tax=Tanacetum coccineum TaxID=301880 RepID=A0ABQ5BY88_9ASTR
MHNNIMAAGSRDRPPMLATGRYAQWRSRFLRYIDTRPNGDALRKCILKGPYTPTNGHNTSYSSTEDSPPVPEQTTVKTVMNMTPENIAHFELEKRSNFICYDWKLEMNLFIYSTVDAMFQTAQEMWEAIGKATTSHELRAERMAKKLTHKHLFATAQHSRPITKTSKPHKSYAPTSKASLPTRSHATTRYKGKEIAKPITPPSESASEEDSDPEQAQRDKDMQKNLALIAKYFKKIYKPTNNNLRTSSNTRNKNVDTTPRYKNDNQTGQFGNQRAVNVAGARETVGGQVVQQSGIQCFNCKEFGHYAKECRKPKRVKDSTYHKEKMLLCKQAEKGVQLQAEQSDWLADMDEEIDEQELEAHYSYMAKIQEQSESITNTCAVETGDSNVIPDSPDMCDNDIQDDQNDVECDDERVALANLIANLKLDVDENKKIQKQLKKANATLTQELTKCKSILAETSRTLRESNSIRDSCLVALQNKQTEFERYKAFNDRTVDYEKLERKLNETLGLLAQKEIDIKEGLKVKAYEISVVKEKHDELVKQSLLTKSHYEGLVKEKTKVITDLKLKEEKDIDKMISMENQLKFLNEIVYKRSQSIQTIHMLAPKCPTFNGRPTFTNPMYLKKAQYEKPCLYAIPHNQSDPTNRLIPDREEILTLEEESRSKLNKDLVKPFDYIKLNSLYEIFKPPTQHYEIQFAQANEIRKKMWRKSFVKTKPNIFKNIDFLPVSKSISKSRQAYNVMTNNINHLKEIVDQAWVKHSNDRLHLRNPTAQDMEILVKTYLKYVEYLEDEIDELESDKAEFSNMYDMLLQECVSNDIMCSYLQSSSDLDEITELQCLYLHKVRECDCLAQKLSEQTEFQQHKLDEVSYHKLFDILKQYQKEVNELRAERMAKNANPLALVATAQTLQDPYYQSSKSHKSYAPTSKASLPTRSHATTRYKGKEIAKPITPPSESASEEDSDPEQAQRDKDMQKNLALIAKYFKKIYKPTNNNLRTSSNTRNKNVDTTPRYKNDNQTGQFGNQRAVNVAGARETVGGQVVQQSGIQCFNCKEFGHYAKECRKPKRVKDSTYHKEKMLLCKQAEKGVQLQAEQSDWLADTDEEIDEQELEAHYSYMAKIQEVPNADSGTDSEPLEQVQYDTDDNVFANDIQHFEQSESISNTCAVETGDSNVIPDSPDMCDNDIQDDQNDVECDDERVALANLIANLKLDVDENKKIQKQLKKANATLTQELTECKSILAETSRTLGESNSI